MRRIVHLLLLFCLPLYGFAMQGSVPLVTGAITLAHALEHEEGVQHHHHGDDGAIHYDDSDESLAHAQENPSSAQPAGFAVSLPALLPEPAVPEAGSYLAQPAPEPFLDGPHRPPALPLGHAAGGMPHA